MLEDTPVCADCFQRCFEASVVLTSFVTPSCFDQSGEAAPSRAGWVGDYVVGACVEACISVLVPRIDTIEPVVGASSLYVECGNHPAMSCMNCCEGFRIPVSHPSGSSVQYKNGLNVTFSSLSSRSLNCFS